MVHRLSPRNSISFIVFICILSTGADTNPGPLPPYQEGGFVATISFENEGSSNQNGSTIALDYKGVRLAALSFAGCQADQPSGTCTIKHLLKFERDANLTVRPFFLGALPGIAPKLYIGDAMVPLDSASQALRDYALFARFTWSKSTLSIYLPKDTVDGYSIEKKGSREYLLVHRFAARVVGPAQGGLLQESVSNEYGYDDCMIDFFDSGLSKGRVRHERARMYLPVDFSCCTRWPVIAATTSEK